MLKEQSKRDYEAITAWFIREIGRVKGLDGSRIDTRVTFHYLGLDSETLVTLTGGLGAWLQREVEPTALWEHPSIHLAAQHFSQEEAEIPITAGQVAKAAVTGRGIAIVGMACRFPQSPNLSVFWTNLLEGKDCISEISGKRLPDHNASDQRVAGWIDSPDLFDHEAFRISPREAEQMDPQQRMLLEVTAEALEDAGLTVERLNGSRTGVFVGISSNDYGAGPLNNIERSDIYAVTGNAKSIAANRISYVWNLRGPSMAVDTACSSSLVAVHLACQSLLTDECDTAIAGGVNLLLNPAISRAFHEAGMLAADGHCKTFSARADGYVRGEGAGAVILKQLDAARRDGDRIYGVIRGSAVNQDGLSNGLTAPNAGAQEEVLLEAYRRANVSPCDIDYVETHGTGTPLGDPIEANTLGKVLSPNRDVSKPCAIGSVKTNIGHLEAAAGIAGLIKTALCLHFGQWVPSLHADPPNPLIAFDELPLRVVQHSEACGRPEGERPLLAGVSAFGFGGTNAHAVIEQYSPVPLYADRQPPKRLLLIPVSARSPRALRSRAADMALFLRSCTDDRLDDVVYTAQSRRTHHAWRAAVIGQSGPELAERLERAAVPSAPGRPPSGILFVYSGQGTQWAGMGRVLFESQPAFRQAWMECDELWRNIAGWPLLPKLLGDEAWAERTDIAQPMVFALQVALTALWRNFGVVPEAVAGHSMGEITAAYTAGVLSLEDALRILYWRSRLMQSSFGDGAMLAVHAPHEEVARMLDQGGWSSLGIAAVNSGTWTVVAGDADDAERLETGLAGAVKCQYVSRHFAFHSAQMDEHLPRLRAEISAVRHSYARIRWYSTVTARRETGLRLGLAHWENNMRRPVRFAETLNVAKADGCATVVEIGPHPSLMPHIEEMFSDVPERLLLYSMRRYDEERSFLSGLQDWYLRGGAVRWPSAGGTCVSLPAYPWEHRSFWTDIDLAFKSSGVTPGPPEGGFDVVEAVPPASGPADPVREILGAAGQPERLRSILEAYLQQVVADVLRIRDGAGLPPDKPLIELGLDSIMALQIRNRLETALGAALPVSGFFDGMTIQKAAADLANLLSEPAPTPPAVLPDNVKEQKLMNSLQSGDSRIEDLSDEEIERMLLLLSEDNG
ncbi:beta-ketoacyl synthase N-terminal-like domain-containing protein [Paenibacillus sp. M1]|uniref:Beta-ketoacyl synthase N-terminal-like domain-containing protein n=1 Tax=Paenibacillus haidiansis TaxID=1574488 RepID=A0ABU7VQR3_9BACL